MKELSDEIISTSTAYGNRFFLESAIQFMEVECVHPGALKIMGHVVYLHMIHLVKETAGWYLERELISKEAAKNLEASFQKAVKDLMPHLNDCIEALGVPMHQNLNVPLARDYIKYNSQRDMDNYETAGPLFDFQKGATRKSQRMARM